jgi:hypothetical protein
MKSRKHPLIPDEDEDVDVDVDVLSVGAFPLNDICREPAGGGRGAPPAAPRPTGRAASTGGHSHTAPSKATGQSPNTQSHPTKKPYCEPHICGTQTKENPTGPRTSIHATGPAATSPQVHRWVPYAARHSAVCRSLGGLGSGPPPWFVCHRALPARARPRRPVLPLTHPTPSGGCYLASTGTLGIPIFR